VFPTEPSSPASRVGIQLHYQVASSSELTPGSSLSLRALEVDTARLYRDVTAQAVWVSSDDAVIRSSGPGLLQAVAPGLAEISASYQGSTASILIPVVPPRSFPYLDIRPLANPRAMGSRSTARALMVQSSNSVQDVTADTTWTSSNSTVATVILGVVTGVTPGTVEIAASYGGYTAAYRLSIYPRGL
jgi:hypothetical protein